jgi:hypothetical protein
MDEVKLFATYMYTIDADNSDENSLAAFDSDLTWIGEYRHTLIETENDITTEQSFVSGYTLARTGEVLQFIEENIHLKMLPLIAVSLPKNPAPSAEETFRGRAYCCLPLPIVTLLPGEVSGFFVCPHFNC